ncbi:GntR family transcriptional regulator [Halomonas sp. HMF6819]|uniref:GntR family transcriptional regulator n=1 Tax=unclassified Halomonas TaxID=2609666 RepID=UPI002076B014|nr:MULTISPECIES: GntR family transcriptional regulator [unclassified Halomonas]
MKKKSHIGPVQSLTDIATERLRTAIINGDFLLGEKIPEEVLSSKLGVSRTPIRDALARLQTIGLVTVRPKRGSFVFEPTSTDVVDICDFRFMVELQAAKRSFSNSPVRFIKSLQLIAQKMQVSVSRNNALEYSNLDSDYHQMFFEYCDNKYLLNAFNLISNRISALRASITSPQPALREISFEEHLAMIDHLKKSNIECFEKVLYTHIMRTQDIYLKALEERKANA